MDLLHSPKKGSVAQLYSASDFGSEGWGLESLRGHKRQCEKQRESDDWSPAFSSFSLSSFIYGLILKFHEVKASLTSLQLRSLAFVFPHFLPINRDCFSLFLRIYNHIWFFSVYYLQGVQVTKEYQELGSFLGNSKSHL